MTLSIGPATDYLVTKAAEAVAGLTISGGDVQVVDGWPHEMSLAMFVIGLSQPPPDQLGDTTGTRDSSPSGVPFIDTDYTIPCYIDVIAPGTTTQKTSRDAAVTIFDEFWALINADLTLGGALGTTGYAETSGFTATPSNVGTAAEPGRRQVITFGVRCRSQFDS